MQIEALTKWNYLANKLLNIILLSSAVHNYSRFFFFCSLLLSFDPYYLEEKPPTMSQRHKDLTGDLKLGARQPRLR